MTKFHSCAQDSYTSSYKKFRVNSKSFIRVWLLEKNATLWLRNAKCCLVSKARYTLFGNNSKIGAKWRKTDVQRIVYKRCSPCFANRFFAVRRICVAVVVSSTNPMYFFVEKKPSAAQKLMANKKQCTATRSSRFRQQYFIRRKNNFVPYSSCLRIVYSGLNNRKWFRSWNSSLFMRCLSLETFGNGSQCSKKWEQMYTMTSGKGNWARR